MNKVLIIAEAGVNHNGDITTAKQMAIVAKEAGADIVKFQTAIPKLVMSKTAEKAGYQKMGKNDGETQLEMANRIHLPLEAYIDLKEYCERTVGIKFLSTPFDHQSIDYLKKIGMDIWKIPSGEITNLPYLQKIGSFCQNVILSTGMSEIWEIERAIKTLSDAGTLKDNISVLHCTSSYPAEMVDLNLKAMNHINMVTGCTVGYSDHSLGIEASIAAVALGAQIIEKHFTLDKHAEGPDHKASLEPNELKQLVRSIRNIEVALGDGIKKVTEAERQTRIIARKSLHATRRIMTGKLIEPEDIIMKRPGNGISPYELHSLVGKVAKRNIEEDEMLNYDDVE